MQGFIFNSSKSIICELGAIRRIGEICERLRIARPLIVTDPGIAAMGLHERLLSALATHQIPCAVFSSVVPDPPEATVLAALELALRERVDGVIGFGGGSSLDTAKLVALMARSSESLQQIYGVEQAKGERLPLILVPTTAGTGSEVTAVAIITTGETTKTGVVASQLYPDVALLDAELTVALPPSITAMTGVDAMVHAIEAYTSLHRKNLYSNMLAREALRLMAKHIETATLDGGNLEARQAMLLGACLAGQAFANAPVAAVHALAYPLGGRYHLPHGLTNSLVLPHMLRFNASHAGALYAELAAVILPAEILLSGTAERCTQLITYFEQLIATLGLPCTLAAVNVPQADLPTLAGDAILQQRLLINNSRPVTQDDALAIYRAAY